jgi:hypothetical protein
MSHIPCDSREFIHGDQHSQRQNKPQPKNLVEDGVLDRIRRCMKHPLKLNEWELQFLPSITRRYARGDDLSEKQLRKLSEIELKIS